MKLKPTFFDFRECEIGFRVPKEIIENNRWGNAIEGCEVDLEPMTKNAALGIKELAATDSQQIKPKMPSLQEFLNFALNDVDGYKTNEEVYNYFARHFGR